MAQQDSQSRRLSAASTSASMSLQKPGLTSSSSSISTSQLVPSQPVTPNTRRMLSEIKPSAAISSENGSGSNEGPNDDKFEHEMKLNELIFASNDESDSTDTSLSILKRNYDIIRKKTRESSIQKKEQNESSLNNSLIENNNVGVKDQEEILVRESVENRYVFYNR